VPLLGRFDPDYLDVPPEVIQLTARTNQKYFVLRDESGALAPAFICTANIDAADGGAAIVAGNQRVLAARLSDARFFWEQDLKVPLDEQAKKLSQIVFHEKLGTVADKVQRVADLAEWLAIEAVVPNCDPDHTRRAAELSKADLVTGMVGEFPELQGQIGGYLARAQGEPHAVAEAVRDHYKPVGQGDEVPTALVTVAVALADKLDTLVGFFTVRERPTGSRDPFALRRAAIGIIELILANNIRLELDHAAARAFQCRQRQLVEIDQVAAEQFLNLYNRPELYREIPDFFVDRLKVQQREVGIRHDIIDAVFALNERKDEIIGNLARVRALQSFIEGAEGSNLLAGYKRAANILKKENWDLPRVMADRGEQGMPQTGEEDPLVLVDEEPELARAILAQAQGSVMPEDAPEAERALVAALDVAEPGARAAVEAEDFRAAMAALASLRGPIDAFFDQVTVNDPAPEVRRRRLNSLARFRDAVHGVADFSRIEG
jgi:glycyl-tRNA synthetase beta chain